MTTYNGTLEKCKKAFAGLTEEEVLAKCGCIGKYECEPESTKPVCKSGVFSSQKTQTVEAAVSIRLVDVSTGLIIYSDEAKGSAELTTKTTMGVGGKAFYDALAL